MKKLKSVFMGLSLLFALVFAPLAVSSSVSAHHCVGDSGADHGSAGASIGECLDAGACLDTAGAGCSAQVGSKGRVNGTLKAVLNILSIAAGVVAVIMIIIGGMKYIMSGGESTNVSGAKNTILYAIIGLIIVVLAQVIVKFVLNKASSDPVPAAAMIQQITTFAQVGA